MNKKWIGIGLGAVVLVGIIALATQLKTTSAGNGTTEKSMVDGEGSSPSDKVSKAKRSTRQSGAKSGSGGGSSGQKRVRKITVVKNTPMNPLDFETELYRQMDAGNYEKALEVAEQLLEKGSLQGESGDQMRLMRARLLISVNRQDDAFEALNEILASVTSGQILKEAAAKYYIVARDSNRMPDAFARQEARVQQNPTDASSLATLARLYQYAQETNAELKIRQRLAAVSSDVDNRVRLAELQQGSGLYEQAAKIYGKLAEENEKERIPLLIKKAQMENAAGKNDVAVKTAEGALSIPDLRDVTAFQLARVIFKAGDNDAALRAFENLSQEGTSKEARERATLEICRIRISNGDQSPQLENSLFSISSSETIYVREQAVKLLNTLK